MQFPQLRGTRCSNRVHDASGFTIIQITIALAIIGVISAFAIFGLTKAKDYLRLQNSVRQLSAYLEKARLDAVRRHGNSSVTFSDISTYVVTMDFDGSGTVSTRTIPFEQGIQIVSVGLPSVNFNWRGRTQACTNTFALQNTGGEQSWVDVSDAGDVTVNANVDAFPSPSINPVNGGSDVNSTAVVTGSTVHNNSADCAADAGGGGGGTGSITGAGINCTNTASPSSVSIRKNGASTATITVNATNTGTVTASGPINLQITPQSQAVTAGSSVTFSIKSLNNTRSTFAVNFTTPCTTVTVLVTVTN